MMYDVQYSTVQYSMMYDVQYSTVQYSTVQYSTVRCKKRDGGGGGEEGTSFGFGVLITLVEIEGLTWWPHWIPYTCNMHSC